jgi:asparagine synthetase B (glutamine-hydrolysing)
MSINGPLLSQADVHFSPANIAPRARGDFSIWGITRQPEAFLKNRLPERLGAAPRVLDFGPAGCVFVYTTYGDVAEDQEAIVLKLGLAHMPQHATLSAQQLLERKLITPRSVDDEAIRGNALVACFSKTAPEFSVYKTLMSMYQMYYSRLDEGVLCSDGPWPQLALLERIAVNEDAIPQYFLFRYVHGRLSYFDGVERLMSGELGCWRDGRLALRLVRDLRPRPDDGPRFTRIDAAALAALRQAMSGALGAYIADIGHSGYDFGAMLSGGIDSTLMQSLINDHVTAPEQRRTFSYVMETPEFEFEVEYAEEAIRLLHTRHTFAPVKPEDYPALLAETVETLGFPIPGESYPCKLALAKHVAEHDPSVRYFFLGNGADTLHGTGFGRKVAFLERARRLPAAPLVLGAAAAALRPLAAKKAHGLRQIAGMLAELDNPRSYKIPVNTVAVYSDIPTARRCFGDAALGQALEYRQWVESVYIGSRRHLERVNMVELLNDAYECSVVTNHLYLAHHREQTYPFMDEQFMRAALAVDPDVRFLKGRVPKPLLRGLLIGTPYEAITRKRKGTSVFNEDVHAWMREGGPLRDMLLAVERPGFVSRADFEQLLTVPTWSELDDPNWFAWNLLVFDLFRKRVARA